MSKPCVYCGKPIQFLFGLRMWVEILRSRFERRKGKKSRLRFWTESAHYDCAKKMMKLAGQISRKESSKYGKVPKDFISVYGIEQADKKMATTKKAEEARE
jgi:hypothetical protein